MSKKNEAATKDLIIESVPIKVDEKNISLSILKIPCDNKTHKVFRVFDEKEGQIFYRSTRLGTLEPVEGGLEADVTGFEKEISGRKYELVGISNKEIVLSGKIVNKKAEANVVNIKKTGTED